jgi:hypothetical protein
MAIPIPIAPSNLSGLIGTKPAYSLTKQLLNKEQNSTINLTKNQRLQFAHSDWAGYSVFEEAFAMGHAAGSLK